MEYIYPLVEGFVSFCTLSPPSTGIIIFHVQKFLLIVQLHKQGCGICLVTHSRSLMICSLLCHSWQDLSLLPALPLSLMGCLEVWLKMTHLFSDFGKMCWSVLLRVSQASCLGVNFDFSETYAHHSTLRLGIERMGYMTEKVTFTTRRPWLYCRLNQVTVCFMVFLPRFPTHPGERMELINTAEESTNDFMIGRWKSSKIKYIPYVQKVK